MSLLSNKSCIISYIVPPEALRLKVLDIMMILGIFCCVKLCLGLETADNKTDCTTQKLHKGTPNVLLTLGDSVKASLLNPIPSSIRGQQTMRELFDYYYNLKDIYQMMIAKDKIERKLGGKLFRMLVEGGGPPHIDIEFDIEDAMSKFEWNNKHVYNVRRAIDDTESLWEKMQIEAEKWEHTTEGKETENY